MSVPTHEVARRQMADRLIGGSIRRSYNSAIDVDWDAPQDPDVFYLPPEGISLYGTPLWEKMSHRERVELSRQEAANMLSRAVWFENTLNQGLLRAMLHQDPTSRNVHYALTEIGDETRHMIMFGRTVSAIGAEPYRLSTLEALTVQLFPLTYRGLFLWVAALCGEELVDDLQRKFARHPDLQPIMQQVMRIHVTEEARHIRYAREGVRRRVQRAPWWERQFAATANGAAGFILRRMMYDGEVYVRCGLDKGEAMRQARANEQVNAVRRDSFVGVYDFLSENGLMNPISRTLWRAFGFLA
ncbi:diiron oxygenase [Antrihabitans sp. YC2-6]|uniref:AurF N-oxygenase family protein n=1 Tax=Antrihabitans sp. YC2-6 TaxID=2799498 RepID=UPI0018F484DC|nr:diiron oxygenase [Antrihabitans sp. YC2-6]MBJ8346918.1 diiron oxygenase [Antrihabitans sp. YC2-6]